MTDPRPICPACGGLPYRLDAIGWSCRCGHSWSDGSSARIVELQAQVAHESGQAASYRVAHESGQAASYRVAYEAALARVGSLQDALDQAIRERDSARERIRELDLAVPMAREAGR